MRVFVTGASGLIGSHLSQELTQTGHEVVALCRGGSDTAFLDRIGCRIVRGDVRADADTMVPLMAEGRRARGRGHHGAPHGRL